MNEWVDDTDEAVILRVRVKPRASKNMVESPLEDRLPVRLTAPPVDEKANKALVLLLSKKFKISKSSIQIISGEKSRIKTLKLSGISKKEVVKYVKGK
jgi:uncharacterized protein